MTTLHKAMFQRLIDARLPGFYVDTTGSLCIIINDRRIAAFIDENLNMFAVTVDTIDDNGDFAKNISWEGFTSHKDAITEIRKQVLLTRKLS